MRWPPASPKRRFVLICSTTAGDMRRNFDKFSDEHFEHNMKLARQLEEIAQKKNVTSAQLSIAWVASQWQGIMPLPGSVRDASKVRAAERSLTASASLQTNPDRVKQSIDAGKITLTAEEQKAIRDLIDSFEVKGVRYAKGHMQDLLFA